MYRDGLAALLSSVAGVEVVGTAADGRQAVESPMELQPDVVVMDVQMPELDGIEATRQITADSPHTGVVVLTMSEDDATVFAAMRAGALGYLLKGANQAEILRAITAVAQGEAIFGPIIARRVAEYFRPRRTVGGRTAVPAADRPGAGDPGSAGRRPVQRADCERAVPVPEDGAEQRVQRLRQAARGGPGRGHRPGQGRRVGTGFWRVMVLIEPRGRGGTSAGVTRAKVPPGAHFERVTRAQSEPQLSGAPAHPRDCSTRPTSAATTQG